MTKLIITLLLATCVSASAAAAEHMLRLSYPLNVQVPDSNDTSTNPPQENGSNEGEEGGTEGIWVSATPSYTEWETGTPHDCEVWTPSPTAYQGSDLEGEQEFVQHGTNCTVTTERYRQDREWNDSTSEYRNVGDEQVESYNTTGIDGTREYAQKLFNWWSTNGENALYDCETFSPEANTIRAGDEFQQAVTNCTESFTRGGMGYYYDSKLGWLEDPDNPYQEFTKEVFGVNRTIRAWGTREWVEGDW